MPTTVLPRAARVGADRCPGGLDLHAAADGPLARVRLPGGYVRPTQLVALAHLATGTASGVLDLTARGNVQLRSVRDPDALADGLVAAGLLPSAAHDRARNVSASPLAGGAAVAVLERLDAGLLADPDLAELPGRFLLSVDDGSGLAAPGDIGWHEGRLSLDGQDAGPGTTQDVLHAARTFLRLRAGDPLVWRVRELPGGVGALAASLGRHLGASLRVDARRLTPCRSGRFVVVAAVLQRVTAEQARAVAEVADQDDYVRLGAAGRLVVPTAADLAGIGLITDPADSRADVTACSGIGACSRATTDVRGHALTVQPARPVHVVACARACGAPADARVLMLG